jgi:hypothetical protein
LKAAITAAANFLRGKQKPMLLIGSKLRACFAKRDVAARTLARSPIRDPIPKTSG